LLTTAWIVGVGCGSYDSPAGRSDRRRAC